MKDYNIFTYNQYNCKIVKRCNKRKSKKLAIEDRGQIPQTANKSN